MGKILSIFKKNNKDKEEEEDQEELAYKAYLADKASTRLVVDGHKIKAVNHPLLNLVFRQDLSSFQDMIQKLEAEMTQKEFEWNLCVCFWFAVHMKYLDFAKFMVDFNINLKKVVHFSRKMGMKDSSIGGDDLSQDREDSKEKNNHTNINLIGDKRYNKDDQVPVRLNQNNDRSLDEESDEEDWKQEGGEDDNEEDYDNDNLNSSPKKNKDEDNQDDKVLQDDNILVMKTGSSKKSNQNSGSNKNMKFDTENSQK